MSKIARRDFINGTLMAAGASMLPFKSTSQAVMAALEPSYYPPALTGLRGSHPGSNEHAHSQALIIGVLQAVQEHMIFDFAVAYAEPAAGFFKQIGRISHTFHATSNNDVGRAGEQ